VRPLYTRELIEESREEANRYIEDIEGLKKFRSSLETKKPEKRKDVFEIFLSEVWENSGYSENYDNPRESFFDEFGDVALWQNSGSQNLSHNGLVNQNRRSQQGFLTKLYDEKTAQRIKARKTAIRYYQQLESDMGNYVDDIESILDSIESIDTTDIDDWNLAESYWNQLDNIEGRIRHLTQKRQSNGIKNKVMLENVHLDVKHPVLADLGEMLIEVDEYKQDIITDMPYE